MMKLDSTIPPLHPIVLSDWIEKLGERAFVCWLKFHSWKTDPTSNGQPYCLQSSLNQLIKKLAIGKNTFYEKILKPLTRYGLVKLKRTEQANRETHLIVYSFPQNCPEKARLPLTPITAEHDTDQADPDLNEPIESSSSIHAFVPTIPTIDATPPEKEEQLPTEISDGIFTELPEAITHLSSIVNVYEQVCEHPAYSTASFLRTLSKCLTYNVNRHYFSAYFLKALFNDWNKPTRKKPAQQQRPPQTRDSREAALPLIAPIIGTSPKRFPSRSSQRRNSDLPEWVIKQQQRQELGLVTDKEDKLSPEQQAIAADLLQKLEALGS
ncbi:hypothetical protein [Ammoniphilus oxalaticus]|nr:hypothetical protein [Ammoniphilus oxalaticus]